MKSVSATSARKQLFDLIEIAGKPGAFVTIKHRDLPDVILMSTEEFEGWEETLEILSDPKLAGDIQAGMKEIAKGKTVSLDALRKKRKR